MLFKSRNISNDMRRPPSNHHRMLNKICLIVCILSLSLFHNALKCNTQRPTTLNTHQQQASNNSALRNKQPANNQLLYQNFSLATNRPLDRPSLTLVSKGTPSKDRDSLEGGSVDGGGDWFMLGGPGADLTFDEGRNVASFSDSPNKITKRSDIKRSRQAMGVKGGLNKTVFDDEQAEGSDSNEVVDDVEDGSLLAGTQKEPDCATHGRFYCTYKEEYPSKLVTEVTKYYKWPLEKLFRDLHAQMMPKLAQDSTGNLVCDSITRVVRPGWARNTNERWLVVINTDNYHQYVTEVVCQYGTNSRCNFIPPCYYSSCQQRYNTQKLLVIDPTNPYRGPFLSEFLFPSCCVCYVPSSSESFHDKYRSSPATIYQRTMQQEAASNLYPPQFRPPGLMEEAPGHLAEQSSVSARASSSGSGDGGSNGHNNNNNNDKKKINQTPALGEIRRGGDQYRHNVEPPLNSEIGDFPRLGLADSLLNQKSNGDSSSEVHQ